MPLPPLKGILPLVIAIWNSIKGGSDATTNLLWRCKGDPPPQRTNQAAVVARMLSLSVVTVHRLFQIIGSSENLDDYANIQNFRKSASKRSTYKQTLFRTVDHILDVLENEKRKREATPTTPQTVAESQLQAVGGGVPTPARRSRRKVVVEKRLGATEHSASTIGSTPRRNISAKLEDIAMADEGDRTIGLTLPIASSSSGVHRLPYATEEEDKKGKGAKKRKTKMRFLQCADGLCLCRMPSKSLQRPESVQQGSRDKRLARRIYQSEWTGVYQHMFLECPLQSIHGTFKTPG